jgi:hypothetical protein
VELIVLLLFVRITVMIKVFVLTNFVFVIRNMKGKLVRLRYWTIRKSSVEPCVLLLVSRSVLIVTPIVSYLVSMIVLRGVSLVKAKTGLLNLNLIICLNKNRFPLCCSKIRIKVTLLYFSPM